MALSQQFVPQNDTPKKISQLQFGLLSGQDMVRLSEIPVHNKELYVPPSRTPNAYGPLDTRLGVSNQGSTCMTCGQSVELCPGHFGVVHLQLPVFNVGYVKAIQTALRMICKTCSRVLLDEGEKKTYLRRVRSKLLDPTQRKELYKKIAKLCASKQQCPYCKDWNGEVKKVRAMKFIHKKFKLKASDSARKDWEDSFLNAIQANADIGQHLNKAGEDMHPTKVLELFKNILPDECELLNSHNKLARPEWMILTHILVPPCAIRPSVKMDMQGSNEDDLTMKIQEIVWLNNIIKSDLEKGQTVNNLMDHWDVLQLQVALYINSDFPGIPMSAQSKKPIRGLCQRLKGKQGRFRGNLSGKRVDFSSRTVISPDPNLSIDEVGVPRDVALILTYPERVSRHNISDMKALVRNGPDVHPGAKGVTYGDGTKTFLKYGDRKLVADKLRIGDIVERHLHDGDVVLFNRQPSLHRVSIMAHRVRVMPWKTFRFNECCCTPYNADFDGDEMNLHLPQTEEARAEALTLMSIKQNLAVPKSGELLISATQDFLTGSYLLTSKDRFFTQSEFSQILAGCLEGNEYVDLPPPAILKPMRLFTGKQIFSVLLKLNDKNQVRANLEIELKNFNKKFAGSEKSMIPNDTYMIIQNGDLLSGQLDKSVLGGGTNTIFSHLLKQFSADIAAEKMYKVAKLNARFTCNHGISIGIADVTPAPDILQRKNELIQGSYASCNTIIQQYENGSLQPLPGCSVEQTLEAKLMEDLSNIRNQAGSELVKELTKRDPLNAALIMAMCGSKGSVVNVAQMVAVVGQQSVSGHRAPDGFIRRTLPHFKVGARDPAAKGFVANSFYTGLTPTEFFFHTMAGREGLVDTAVKTAETGYMQRRLMKALEDLCVQYDNTVRGTGDTIVQFKYGDDGVEPTLTESPTIPFNVQSLWNHVSMLTIRDDHVPLLPCEFQQIVDDTLSSAEFAPFSTHTIFSHLKQLFNNDEKTGLIDLLVEYRRALGYEPWGNESTVREVPPSTIHQVTRRQIVTFLRVCVNKLKAFQVEPGTAVGALCAQSIGEPCTQMTLKTFHFAGVASMNITLGVPRIREIINATKNISTPVVYVALENNTDPEFAKRVRGTMERVTLGQISVYIREVYERGSCYLVVKIDYEHARQNLHIMDLTPASVIQRLTAAKKLKLKANHVHKFGKKGNKLKILPPENFMPRGKKQLVNNAYFTLQALKALLPAVVVSGIDTCTRCVVSKTEKENEPTKYSIIVEGSDLTAIMGKPGVNFAETKSNHILEISKSLGIEAARSAIIDEISYTMREHSVSVDARHLGLLGDCMTYRGEVLGITRFGIAKMKDSVLMLASFEKTTDYLFEAGQQGTMEPIKGVSECIIMGRPVPVGTGLFRLLQDSDILRSGKKYTPEPTLFKPFDLGKL